MDKQTFLLAMYKEQCDQARQHESQRQQGATLVLALCSAMTVFAGATAAWASSRSGSLAFTIPLLGAGIFICLLGVFGRRFSLKHYERSRLHVARATIYREDLEKLYPGVGDLRTKMDKRHADEWLERRGGRLTWVIKASLFRYWISLHSFIILWGAALVVVSLALHISPARKFIADILRA